MNPPFDHSAPQMETDFRMARLLNESLDNIRLIQSIESVFNAGDPVTATALAGVFRQHDWDLRCKSRADELARARWWASGWNRLQLDNPGSFDSRIYRLNCAVERIISATKTNP